MKLTRGSTENTAATSVARARTRPAARTCAGPRSVSCSRIDERQPENAGERQQDFGDENRERQRRGKRQQRRVRRAFEAAAGRRDARHDRRSRAPAVSCALRRRKDVFGPQRSQASEIARLTNPLIAWPAGQARLLPPTSLGTRGSRHGAGPRGQRRSVNPDDRRRGRGRDVQRSGVAADEQPAPGDQRPEFRQVELAEVNDAIRRTAPSICRAVVGDSAGRLTIRRARAEHDAPRGRRAAQAPATSRCESRLRPAPERVARAHVHDDQLVAPARRPPRAAAASMRASAAGSSGISTPSRAGSGAPAGHPGIASSRSHWFTTECRGRNVRGRATARVYIQRAPLDLVADSLGRAASPAPARRSADRRGRSITRS